MANQKAPGSSWGGKHCKVFRQETFSLTFSNSILVMLLFIYLFKLNESGLEYSFSGLDRRLVFIMILKDMQQLIIPG